MNRRIALISEHASPLAAVGGTDTGGQNIAVAELSRHLATLGYEIDVFTRWDDRRVPKVVHWRAGIRIIHVEAGPVTFIPKEKLLPWMPAFTSDMIGFMKTESNPYKLIHAHFFMSAQVAADIKQKFNIPFIVTFHALAKVRRLHQGASDWFPDEGFAIEERVLEEADQWVVDPLDGTENLGGYPPLVGISIGLLRNGQPVLGVIFDPIHDLLYRAREGGQVTENGKRMRVSAQPEPDRALIGLDFSSRMETRPHTLAQLACVLKQARAVKVLGVPALSLAAVASGRLDLFFRPASKPGDLVAGACLVRAAGGEVMDFGGTDWTIQSKGIIAGPGRMVEAYLSCFSQAGKKDMADSLERG